MKRSMGMTLIAGLIVAAPTVVAASSHPDPDTADPNATFETADQARETDTDLLAESMGWTTEQANRQVERADTADEIRSALLAQYPDAVAGGALSQTPGEPATFYFKGDVPVGARAIVAASGAPDTRLVGGRPYSLTELTAAVMDTSEALGDMGFDQRYVALNEATGRLRSVVTREPGLPRTPAEVVDRLSTRLRGLVDMEVTPQQLHRPQHARGGQKLRYDTGDLACTSGWSVFDLATGTTGIATAQHCHPEVFDIVMHDAIVWMSYRAGHYGVLGDMSWYTTSHAEEAYYYATDSSVRAVHDIETLAEMNQWDPVCVYGRASNNRVCGSVMNTVVACGSLSNLAEMDRSPTTTGDSGGGFSYGNTAWGITMGTCSNRIGTLFSKVDLIDDALGVAVRVQ